MAYLITPDTNPQKKVRHGCLTAYLILMIWGGLAFLYMSYGLIQSQTMPLWQILFAVSVEISYFIWIIALFKWKEWGFWGWCLTVAALIIYNLIVGDSIIAAFYPLVGLGILYGVLQIGGENKGWNQLEGPGILSQRHDRETPEEYPSDPDSPGLVNNEISLEGQKQTSHSSIAHDTTLTEILPPNSSNSTNVKQRDRTLKVLGGGCLIITLCCVAGYIWMEVTTPLSNVGVTKSSDGYPKWSPDGSRIAFVSFRDGNTDIYVMDSDGSNVIQLTEDPYAMVNFLWSSARDLYPTWSPDGRQIVFSSERDDTLMSLTNYDTYIMDADGSNQVRLSEPGHQGLPAWSPDGQHIVLALSGNGHYDEEIYIMDADGSNLERLTFREGDDSYPSWSPDGKRILFAAERNGFWDIYVMDADASNRTRLTKSGNDIEPFWSPDGEHIVFTSDRDGNPNIYIMDADGTNVTLLTDGPGNANNPSWSPDGDRIAFSSDRDGDWEIYVMDNDGSNTIQLTHNK
jgi:Tol biopolymer transport system component